MADRLRDLCSRHPLRAVCPAIPARDLLSFITAHFPAFITERCGPIDLTGDYTMVWWLGVGVGAFSALIHLPIREKVLMPQAA